MMSECKTASDQVVQYLINTTYSANAYKGHAGLQLTYWGQPSWHFPIFALLLS